MPRNVFQILYVMGSGFFDDRGNDDANTADKNQKADDGRNGDTLLLLGDGLDGSNIENLLLCRECDVGQADCQETCHDEYDS